MLIHHSSYQEYSQCIYYTPQFWLLWSILLNSLSSYEKYVIYILMSILRLEARVFVCSGLYAAEYTKSSQSLNESCICWVFPSTFRNLPVSAREFWSMTLLAKIPKQPALSWSDYKYVFFWLQHLKLWAASDFSFKVDRAYQSICFQYTVNPTFLYSVSYRLYKKLFYIQSNKGTAGSQKIPSYHQVCLSNAD